MQALLDLAQSGASIVTGGWLMYAVLLTLAEFNAAPRTGSRSLD